MRDMAMPHPTSATAWRRVQGNIMCSLAPGPCLLPKLLCLAHVMHEVPYPSVSLPSPGRLLCLVAVLSASDRGDSMQP